MSSSGRRSWRWAEAGCAVRSHPKAREVIAALGALGFEEIRQRVSHKRFRHPDGRTTTVPVHGGRDVSPILLRQIARDIGLTVKEFVAHR